MIMSCSDFQLLIWEFLHPNKADGVEIITADYFRGWIVIGQLADPLFLGWVCVIPSLFYLQVSRCWLQVWHLHLESVAVNSQYEVKRADTAIRETAKIIGMAKSTVCYILKKKDCTGELSGKTVETGRSCSWSKAYHLICQAWWR